MPISYSIFRVRNQYGVELVHYRLHMLIYRNFIQDLAPKTGVKGH